MPSVCILILLCAVFNLSYQMTYVCDRTAACGCSKNPAVIGRIVGGEAAPQNTWGWAVSISVWGSLACTGTILSRFWVITAVNCVIGTFPSDIILYAGTNQLLGQKQQRGVSALIMPPTSNMINLLGGIALIQVSQPFNMTDDSISRICLPMMTTEDYPPINSTVVAIGWGEATTGGDLSAALQQVTLQRIAPSNNRCVELITNQTMQFCAGSYNETKGTCIGDLGSPVMMFSDSHQWVLVGITVLGTICGSPNSYNAYTRIVPFLNWIGSMNMTEVITVSNLTYNTIVTSTSTTYTTQVTTQSTNGCFSYYKYFHGAWIVTSIVSLFIIACQEM